jgi:hypothetical protein
MNIKEEILAQVKKGKLDKALETFEQWAAKNDDELHNNIIMQLSRFNGLKRNEMMGLITSADANLTRNQITYALTSMLEELDDHPALKTRGGGGNNGTPPPIAPKIRKLFISYAREDRKYVDQLEKHLSALKRSGHIDSWTDSEIKAGQAWGTSIEENLRNADMILYMVSADFLNSKYIYEKERPIAEETRNARGSLIIPVIVRPSDWTSEDFAQYQAVPYDESQRLKPISEWDNLDSAYLSVVREIRNIINS